jgi:hypothetical protein
MNANAVTKHYSNLTPEERFRLMVAARARGDAAERDRLINSGQRITVSTQDHAPYARAFDELAFLIFIELLEEAARYLEAFVHADDVHALFGDDDQEEVDEEHAVAEAPAAEREGSEGNAKSKLAQSDSGARSSGERYLDLALAAGFVLRTKVDGWKRFCERLTIPPLAFWEGLPGYDRLQRALKLTENAAFDAEGFVQWLNRIRPAGYPQRTLPPLTVEGMAAAAEKVFRERVERWGG